MGQKAVAEDSAWARIALPLSAHALHRFLCDGERLLRINPCLEFDRLERTPQGGLRISGRNESNQQVFDTVIDVVPQASQLGLTLHYRDGIKRETRFEIEPDGQGSVLRITEVYDTPAPAKQEQGLKEVDRSLVPWAAALRKYLSRRARWAGMPGYRWITDRFWLGMRPRERRVAWLIVWTTLVEFIVFLVVLAIYLAR